MNKRWIIPVMALGAITVLGVHLYDLSRYPLDLAGMPADYGIRAWSPDSTYMARATSLVNKDILGRREYYYVFEIYEQSETTEPIRSFSVKPTRGELLSYFPHGTGEMKWMEDSSCFSATVYGARFDFCAGSPDEKVIWGVDRD